MHAEPQDHSSQMPKGLFRLRGEPRLVQVQFGPFSRPVSEHEYQAARYRPPLQDLPWQRDHEAGADHVGKPRSAPGDYGR